MYFNNIVYKQINGVPQGGNVSPLLADLTLSVFEFHYSLNNIHLHRNFYPFRYMDDLLIIHNRQEESINDLLIEVYNNTLKFEKTHFTEYHCNYLDLEIKIIDNNIITKIFNKTDNFNFKVIRFPHYHSNISLKIKSSVIYTEILRIARTCSLVTDFKEHLKHLKLILYKNNYPEGIITRNIFKCINKNRFIMLKYNLHNYLSRIHEFLNA